MRITEIQFGSLLSYCPRGDSKEAINSRNLRTYLKNDQYVKNPQIPEDYVLMTGWIARTIHNEIDNMPFKELFPESTVLVPAPGSSLMKSSSLWVPNRLALALNKQGIGSK